MTVELSVQGVADQEDYLQKIGYTDQGREALWFSGSEFRMSWAHSRERPLPALHSILHLHSCHIPG